MGRIIEGAKVRQWAESRESKRPKRAGQDRGGGKKGVDPETECGARQIRRVEGKRLTEDQTEGGAEPPAPHAANFIHPQVLTHRHIHTHPLL